MLVHLNTSPFRQSQSSLTGQLALRRHTDRGMDVTLLQRSEQVLRSTLDFDMACLVHKELKKQGVHLYFNQKVASVEQQLS